MAAISLFSNVDLPALFHGDSIPSTPKGQQPTTPSRIAKTLESMSPFARLPTGLTPKALSFSVFASLDILSSEFRKRAVRFPSLTKSGSSHDHELDEHVHEEEGPREICPYFLKGGCRFRKNCRLSHDIGNQCPYCKENIPETWTQQSKHLKRCWEAQVEDEELKLSAGLTCESCGIDVVGEKKLFGLMRCCEHSICSRCAEKRWSGRRHEIECPTCHVVSDCVINRDRIYADPDRKSKMFGIFMKKVTQAMERAASRSRSSSTSSSRRNSRNL